MRVFRLNGESWDQIVSKTRGRYILLCADGAENTFCIQYLNKSISYALIITLSTAAVILLLLIVIFKKLRKKRKKSKAAEKSHEKDINCDKAESDAKEAEKEKAEK